MASSSTPININTASAEILETIPNIGGKRAAVIIQARQEKGSLTLEDVKHLTKLSSAAWDQLVSEGVICFEPVQIVAPKNLEEAQKVIKTLTTKISGLHDEVNKRDNQMRLWDGELDKRHQEIETLKQDLTHQIQETTKLEETNKVERSHFTDTMKKLELKFGNALREKDSEWEEKLERRDTEYKQMEESYQRRVKEIEGDLARIKAVNKLAPDGIYSKRSKGESENDDKTNTKTKSENDKKDTKESDKKDNTDRHRSFDGPITPKMSTFDGRNDWRPFYTQFAYIAARYRWTDEQRLDKLVECLRDKALKFFSTRPDIEKNNFDALCEKLNERFGKKDLPHIIRRQLQDVRQDTEETLEEFEERVRDMAVDGYPNMSDICIQTVAVDAFLKGCNNKQAYLTAMDKNPANLDEARQYLKSAITNQRLILGVKKTDIKRVTFKSSQSTESDSEEDETTSMHKIRTIQQTQEPKNVSSRKEISYETRLSSIENKVKNIENDNRETKASINQILDILKRQNSTTPRSRSNSGERYKISNQSPTRNFSCFNCQQEGHFALECPNRRFRSPSPQGRSRPLNSNRSEM